MILPAILDPFVEGAPAAVMTRLLGDAGQQRAGAEVAIGDVEGPGRDRDAVERRPLLGVRVLPESRSSTSSRSCSTWRAASAPRRGPPSSGADSSRSPRSRPSTASSDGWSWRSPRRSFATPDAFFLVRWHRSTLPFRATSRLHRRGRCRSGEITEQTIEVEDGAGGVLALRRIVSRWDEPTRDGDTEIVSITGPERGRS